MKRESIITKWSSGWTHKKMIETFDCGQVITTIKSSKPGVLFIFVQTQDVRSNGKKLIERVVLTPGGNVQEKLTCEKMSLSDRCKRMEEISDWLKSKSMVAA